MERSVPVFLTAEFLTAGFLLVLEVAFFVAIKNFFSSQSSSYYHGIRVSLVRGCEVNSMLSQLKTMQALSNHINIIFYLGVSIY